MRRRPLALALLLTACGSPTAADLGGFHVELPPDGPLLLQQGAFELSLAPERAFGFRRVRADFETQFGSFRISETPESELRTADRLDDVEVDGARLTATLLDDDANPIATLVLEPAGESLRLSATPLEAQSQASVAFRYDHGPILGFGAQTHDVDHQGQVVPIFVSEQGVGKVDSDEPAEIWFLVGTRHQSYLPVPTLLAPRGGASYGLHATTFHRSSFDLGATDPDRLEVRVGEGTIELLLAPGPSPLDVVRQQTEHNGRIALPPEWTFGVWMEAIGGATLVEAEAEALRAAHIPASAIWSEDWRGGRRNGRDYLLEEDWRADPVLYPDLPGLVERLHQKGLKFMSYFNTFVVEGVDVAEALQAHLVQTPRGEALEFSGNTFEPTGLADLFLEEHRSFVRDELIQSLQMGVDGWMADFAEWYPADPKAVRTSDGSDPEVAHQRYPLAWAEVNREAVAAAGRSDAVIFHRSGYSGSQGQAQVIWAGDQRTDFQADDGLPTVVPIMLGLSVTGFPVVTHDVGGYASATNPPTDKALFFRWTSLGALSPVMRTHHGRSAFANWRWSSDPDTTAHFRRWAELHTRLFPFFMGLAREAAQSGAPIVRPMSFADPGDVALAGIKDQFLLGDALLVAPVLTASTSERPVQLPRGLWYELASGRAEDGGRAIQVALPLTELGLYARAGAVVPTLPPGVESLVAAEGVESWEAHRFEREVWIWLGANGQATDASGGQYQLESPGRPVGALTPPSGTTVLEQGDGLLVLQAEGNFELSLLDEAGLGHQVVGAGHDPRLRSTLRIRW